MIEVKNLKKNYGSFKALHGISFNVERGHVYGFLGPNGAGKSTTMNIISGCLAASEGTVTINGHDIFRDPIAAKKCIGYLPEIPPLYPDMKVMEYLEFVGRAKGVSSSELYSQIDEVIDLTGLGGVHTRLIKNLSKGYKQRVGIAQAMLGNPEVIILDEPTVGLDPIQIIEIRSLIRSLSETHTVILSSHILSEVSAVCDRIMIISGGRLVANDTIEGLERKYSSEVTLELECRTTKERLENVLSGLKDAVSISFYDTDESGVCGATIIYKKANDIRDSVWKILSDSRITVLSMIPKIVTLEDIFLSLTGQNEGSEESYDADAFKDTDSADDQDATSVDRDEAEDDENDSGDDEYKPLFS